MASARGRQGDADNNPRKFVIGGSVSEVEKAEIEGVFVADGFPDNSTPVRKILQVYSRVPAIREAVKSHFDKAA